MSLTSEAVAILEQVQYRLQAGEKPETIRREILGTAGSFGTLMKQIAFLSGEERQTIGKQLADIRTQIQEQLDSAKSTTKTTEILVDRTVPAAPTHYGTVHPISRMIEQMVDIFGRLSFEVVEGNELVGEEENFDMLNIGPDHPARDDQDSFFIKDNLLLRTQTTAVQVLEMRARMKDDRLPIRIVVPGKTYRRESDQTHSPMFHQIDAVMVDTQTTFADLKGCLDYFIQELFGDDVETRFRPHHFPFTEPSAELDIRWKGGSRGEGKHTGWLEMGGCGMIHPAVLKHAGINPRIYQGWAFGMAIERPVMVKYGIPDLRRLYENSLPFLSQFP